MYKPFEYNQTKTTYLELGNNKMPKLLYLPGYMGSAYASIDLLNLLSSKFHVFAIDYPFIHENQTTSNLENILIVLYEFIQTYNLQNAILVGESIGGIVASHLITKYELYPERIILLNSAPRIALSSLNYLILQSSKNLFIKTIAIKFLKSLTIFARGLQPKRYSKQRLALLNNITLKYWNQIIDSAICILQSSIDTDMEIFRHSFARFEKNQKIAILFRDDKLIKSKNHETCLAQLGFHIILEEKGGHNNTSDWALNVYKYFQT